MAAAATQEKDVLDRTDAERARMRAQRFGAGDDAAVADAPPAAAAPAAAEAAAAAAAPAAAPACTEEKLKKRAERFQTTQVRSHVGVRRRITPARTRLRAGEG
jgi:hypothetical protein